MRGKFTGSGNGFEDYSPDGSDRNLTSPEESEIDLFALTGLFVKRKKWIAITVGSVLIVATVILLILPNKYTSTASILPSGKVNKLAELAEVSGVGGFALKDENSSTLFPVILRSRLVHEAVLDREYTFTHNSKPMTLTLAEYFGRDNPDRQRQALANITSIGLDKKTGVIEIAVETKYPEFSRAILSQYLAELETFNLHKRRSQARDNAQYLARQQIELELELRQAEDSLGQFQRVNRDWASTTDPEILKMLTRLQRDIELKSKTYFFLRQELEIAKLDAQKDVPIVRILDQPSLPAEKSSPHRLLIIAVCGMVSLFAVLFLVVVFEALKKRSAGPNRESYETLREELHKSFSRDFLGCERRVSEGAR